MTTIASYLESFTHSRPDRRHWVLTTRAQSAFLYLTDILVLCASLALALAVRGAVAPVQDPAQTEPGLALALLVVAWIVALRAFRAYALREVRTGSAEYKSVLLASVTTAGVTAIVCFLARIELSRMLFALLFGVGVSALLVTRWLRRRAMVAIHKRGLLTTKVVVVGASRPVDAITSVLRRESWIGYNVIGAVTRERQQHTASGVPVLGGLGETIDVLKANRAGAVIFAEGSFASPSDSRRMAWALEQLDIQMMVVPNLSDVSAERLDVRPVAGLPLVDVARPGAVNATRWLKRSFDIVGSALLLLLASPVLAIVALAIKLEDGGPVIFRQVRVGRGGEEFNCLKFRSMCVDAEARLAALRSQNEGAGVLFKMANDPRITQVGRVIRRFSLDELPQLWNALRGDMSLVGPRPALPSEVAQYEPDTTRRLDVRPGLTGLWQVSGRSNLSWEDTVRLDLYYVDNWSMVQDMMILVKTARAVVGRDGAY